MGLLYATTAVQRNRPLKETSQCLSSYEFEGAWKICKSIASTSGFEANWKGFLEALPSRKEKEAFEELMNHWRRHAGAAGAAVRPIVSEAMIMSMLLAHEKMILEMKKSIQELGNVRNWNALIAVLGKAGYCYPMPEVQYGFLHCLTRIRLYGRCSTLTRSSY